MEPAIALAHNESADCLRLSADAPTPSHDVVRVAEASVRLTRSLARQGWRLHQHHEDTFKHEPQSTPLPAESIPHDVRALADAIHKKIISAYAGKPPPHLNVTTDSVPTDDTGAVLLPLPSVIDSDTLERTINVSRDEDYAIRTWKQIVPELAEGWATFPAHRPLSWGRIFLEPRQDRLIYWPRALNLILSHLPISYDQAADVVRILTLLGFKIDLKAAFRSLRIAAHHSRFYGAVLDTIFIEFLRAPFGTTCSPAQFVLLLRQTIVRVRGDTPGFDQAVSAFVDDLAGGAGPDPGTSPPHDENTAARNLMVLADRLVSALIADGWWISIPKTFLWPARRLYYTGIVIMFREGQLGVHPEKAARLRLILSQLHPPDPSTFRQERTSHPPDHVVPQLRTAASAEPSVPIAVAALPLVPDQWPATPIHCLRVSPLEDSIAGVIPPQTITVDLDQLQSRLSSLHPAPLPVPGSPRRPSFVLILVPSFAVATTVVAETSPDTARSLRAPIVVAYPAADQPLDPTLAWFAPEMQLPWPTARSLPTPDSPPPPLPPTTPPTPPSITHRPDPTLHITEEEYAALQTVLGYLSWLSSVVHTLGRWLPSLHRTRTTARWTPDAVTAVAFLWDIAPFLPLWRRDVRRLPTSTLHIAVDTSRGSWAAIRPPDRMIVGTIPMHARNASTLAREAWGTVSAVQSHIRRGPVAEPIDAVEADVDNAGLAASSDASTVPTHDAAPPLRMLAALDYQGVAVRLNWRSRSTPHMQLVDSATTAAGVRVNPLRRHVATYLFAAVHLPSDPFTRGWHADGPSDDTTSWTGTYVTAGSPEPQRRALFEAAAACAARSAEGWLGDIAAWPHVRQQRILFAHPLWSQLHHVASLAAAGCPMVVIAPLDAAGQWWSPSIDTLRRHASVVRVLPAAATDPATAPSPRDPAMRGARFPHPAVADVRRLGAYFVHTRCSPVPCPPVTTGRPLWWTPYRLTDDGDVEEHPGPAGLGTRSLARTSPTDLLAFSRPSLPVCGQARPPAHPLPPSTASARPPAPQRLGRDARAPRTRPPPPRCRPPSPRSRPATASLPSRSAAGFARQPPPDTAAAPLSGVSLGTKRPRTHSLPPGAANTAPSAPSPAEVAAAQAKKGLVPLPAATATIRTWLDTLSNYLKGHSAGTVDDSVPDSLQPFLALARATTRLKVVIGSSRPEKSVRYLTHLATALPGVMDAPASWPAIDALATAYAVRRLDPNPPFGWKKCASADTPSSDLSSLAELSRKAGIPMKPQLGPTASSYLSARGAGASPEHSDAWPIHLPDIAAHEPPSRAHTDPRWITWAACLICSAFCLRPGVLPFLLYTMFLPWDHGYILIWQWMFKSRAGDVLDPELKSKVVRVAAARFPLLTRVFQTLARLPKAKPMFPASVTRDMSAFIQDTFPSAPKGFTFRVYGIRIAADVSACALDIPEEITNAMFWWRTLVKSMRAYYGALLVRRMYVFSEARMRLRCIHLTPGRYDARLKGKFPDLSAKAMLKAAERSSELPPLNPTQLDAAWGADPSIAQHRKLRIERVTLGDGAWADLPAQPPTTDDNDDTKSLDCDGCDSHLDRKTKGTLCDAAGCKAVKCVRCHPFDTIWRCQEHPLPKRRKAAPPAKK